MRVRFDRGTVLVEPSPCTPLPCSTGLRWDDRVAAHRAPACSYVDVARDLARAGHTVDDQTLAAALARRLPRPLRPPDLRPYQRGALAAWEVAGRRGVVVLPTGSGKTRVAVGAVAACGLWTLVLVPTRVLLGQWVRELRGFYDGPLGVVGDGAHELEALTVSTFEGAYRHLDATGDRFGLLVVDEAHHLGGALRREALETCAAPARLGLTATPPSARDALLALHELVGPVVARATVAELSGRCLAHYDRVRVLVELSAEERERYERAYGAYLEAYGAFSRLGQGRGFAAFRACASSSRPGQRGLEGWREARRVVTTARAKLGAVAAILARHATDRVLLFTGDNASAYTLSRELLVPAITCDIQRVEREAVLAGLREGRYRAVVSSRVLNEGLDLPEVSVAIIAGGSGGAREHTQRLGRLLRAGPGKRAVLYEVLAARTYEVEHAWRRAQALD